MTIGKGEEAGSREQPSFVQEVQQGVRFSGATGLGLSILSLLAQPWPSAYEWNLQNQALDSDPGFSTY